MTPRVDAIDLDRLEEIALNYGSLSKADTLAALAEVRALREANDHWKARALTFRKRLEFVDAERQQAEARAEAMRAQVIGMRPPVGEKQEPPVAEGRSK